MASGQMPDTLPDPGVFREIAAAAEALEFDSLWCGDHISFGNPILEGAVALAAFAGYTTSITLGSGVLLLPLRPPALVAKQMASLDYLCGGRLICGVGVGGESAKDFEAVGVDRAERGARMDEAIEVLRKLWSGDPVSHRGRFFEFSDVALSPAPTQSGGPPIWVGGRSDSALRRAGRLGNGWIGYMVSPARFASSMSVVRAHATTVEGPSRSLAAALMVPTRVGDDGAEARERLRRHLSIRYHIEFSTKQIENLCLAGTAAEVRTRVDEYVAAGVEHFIFLFGGDPSIAVDQFERLHSGVVSLVRETSSA